MATTGQLLLFIAIVLVGYIIYAYNKGIIYRNYVREAFSTMDVYLKKRWDLVPNLLDLVKEYSKYEQKLLNDLTVLRTKEYSKLSTNEKIATNQELGQVLSKFVAVAENYPDLKANQTYTTLMQQMENVENDIANARKYYNGTVRELNTFLEVFPTSLIGAIFHIEKARLFNINENERENIKVEL